MSTIDDNLELEVMANLYKEVQKLQSDPKTLHRVITWLLQKTNLSEVNSASNLPNSKKTGNGITGEKIAEMEDVSEVMAKANPKTDAEKVLIVASFLQGKNQSKELTGRELSQELHHMGHKVANITMAINTLKNKKPQLMIQTKKEGNTKQAQKKYKVTSEGLKVAHQMFNGIVDKT